MAQERQQQAEFVPLTQEGQFNNIYFGDPSMHGHVDAPHAQEMTPEMIKAKMYTGEFKVKVTRSRPSGKASPSEFSIYANKTFRKFMGVDAGGTINIDGQTFTVKQARKRADNGKRARLTVHPDQQDKIAKFIAEKCRWDEQTGEIAQAVIDQGASGIIATVNREFADINRFEDQNPPLAKVMPGAQKGAIDEYRKAKSDVLEHMGKKGTVEDREEANSPYLHIAIHGKKDFNPRVARDCDIEIGTVDGSSANEAVLKWFTARFAELIGEKRIKVNGRFPKIGVNQRLRGHASKDMGPDIHGGNYNTIQLELCNSIRYQYGDEMAAVLFQMLKEFETEFVNQTVERSETNEIQHDIKDQIDQVLSEEKQQLQLTVRKSYKEDEHKGIIAISQAEAAKLGVETGSYVEVGAKGIKYAGLLSVKIIENLKPGLILMDEQLRESFGVDDMEDATFEFKKTKVES